MLKEKCYRRVVQRLEIEAKICLQSGGENFLIALELFSSNTYIVINYFSSKVGRDEKNVYSIGRQYNYFLYVGNIYADRD